MAGRGRGGMGRGRGMSFNIESLGFGRGESLPGPILQPPPLFEPLEFKPVPLNSGEEHDYLLALKQEFRGTMRDSPYFIKPSEKKRDISRYSDKYQLGQQDQNKIWNPDWKRLPAELQPRKKRRKQSASVLAKPKIPKAFADISKEDIVKNLEELAKKEQDAASGDEDGEEENAAETKNNEEEEEEELFDEDELEDETDYNLNYFDNGENYGADEDDDLDEGPIY